MKWMLLPLKPNLKKWEITSYMVKTKKDVTANNAKK